MIERLLKQAPYRIAYDRRVVVDQKLSTATQNPRMPRKMDLADVTVGQHWEVTGGIETEIGASHVDIVDVEKNAAFRAPSELCKEFRLGNCGVRSCFQAFGSFFATSSAPELVVPTTSRVLASSMDNEVLSYRTQRAYLRPHVRMPATIGPRSRPLDVRTYSARGGFIE